ncbi:MAG: Hsp20/alpha crystallin family protein [Chloroflexi bacterium]|nr:Hsp20/alpha crystallin family protein [Chloroflexota bacterium]
MNKGQLPDQEMLSTPKASNQPRFFVSAIIRQSTSRPHIWQPPTDVYETKEALVVRVEIAGMKDAEFTISLENQVLVIYGLRSESVEQRAYKQLEIRFGEFMTIVEVTNTVDVDDIEASYEDGFLKVVLPKTPPSRIKVKKETGN